MNTITPENETIALSILSALEHEEVALNNRKPSIEVPLQEMFDEFVVYISKSDFE